MDCLNYKISIYNHVFEVKGERYIYNLLSTGIAQLDDKTYTVLNTGNLSGLDNETFDALINEGFIVKSNVNEVSNFQYYFDRARYSSSADTLTIVFIPSYNCNLRCPYCYEGNDKKTVRMSVEQVDAILNFVEKQIEYCKSSTPIKGIEASLYGGEPMMNKDLLTYFCKGIRDIAIKYDLSTFYDMATNLTLLDASMIELIKNYNIMLQVSLDGVKSQHDIRRIYPNGKGTYDKIIDNLEKLLSEGLKRNIIIRANIDYENIGQAEELFELMRRYSDDIYFGALTTYNDQYDKQCMESNCCNALLLDTHYIYQKNGLSIPQKFGKKGPCSLNCENKFMIDCYLNVYKCDLLINHEDCKVGIIDKNGDIEYNANFYKQMNFSPFEFEKCKQCKFLPICAGGCPAKAYIDSKRKDAHLECNCDFDEEKLNACLVDFVSRNS